jgi:ABC-type antimicrobial peptide transport system permease subunit
LYGVVSYVVAGRTGEFGVRLALGATPSSIMALVLGYGLRIALVGGVAGIVAGFGALRVIEGMLFGSWSSAPLAAAFALVLAVVTLVACAIPAIRATRTSPVVALRSE